MTITVDRGRVAADAARGSGVSGVSGASRAQSGPGAPGAPGASGASGAKAVFSQLAALHRDIDALQPAARPRGPLGSDQAAAMLREVDRAIRRLQSVRLDVVAAADQAQVGDESGLTGTGAWLSAHGRVSGADGAADVRLASALSTQLAATREALASGALSTEHAAVIAQTTHRLPDGLGEVERRQVEQALVRQAHLVDPPTLRKAARRALAAAARSQAEVDEHEDSMLRSDEARALSRSRLTWRDNGDGTTSGHFTLPTLAASILVKTVQQMASPRRFANRAADQGARTAGAQLEAFRGVDWPQRYGQALAELVEHLPTDRLSGKVAATVVVHLDLDRLKAAVGAAHLDTGHDLSASEARRLACNAGIVPVVLGGRSLPLDLGHAERFFTESQRLALATLYDACAADGCDRPFAWSELHHEDPWASGGRTDLAKAVPLCGHHHRRIHDPGYSHAMSRHPSGAKRVTFTRRT